MKDQCMFISSTTRTNPSKDSLMAAHIDLFSTDPFLAIYAFLLYIPTNNLFPSTLQIYMSLPSFPFVSQDFPLFGHLAGNFMSSSTARTGRQKQRYKDHLRLVSGCIPYKIEKNEELSDCNSEKRLLVLMISTPNRHDLVFPKGGWEVDETVTEAACREALEEAGVKGILSENPLGVWEFRSKTRMNSSSLEGGCRGYMFALEVTEELDSWPEQAYYQRKWLTIEEASSFCRYEWMKEALKRFSDDRENHFRESLVESPMILVTEAVPEDHKIPSPGCDLKNHEIHVTSALYKADTRTLNSSV